MNASQEFSSSTFKYNNESRLLKERKETAQLLSSVKNIYVYVLNQILLFVYVI